MKTLSNQQHLEEAKEEIIDAVFGLLNFESSHGYIKSISDLTSFYLDITGSVPEGQGDILDLRELSIRTHMLMKFVSQVEPLVNKLRPN